MFPILAAVLVFVVSAVHAVLFALDSEWLLALAAIASGTGAAATLATLARIADATEAMRKK